MEGEAHSVTVTLRGEHEAVLAWVRMLLEWMEDRGFACAEVDGSEPGAYKITFEPKEADTVVVSPPAPPDGVSAQWQVLVCHDLAVWLFCEG